LAQSILKATLPREPARPSPSPLRIVIEQNPIGSPVQILKLPGPQRPQKHREPAPAEKQTRRDQPQNDRHARARKLLPITNKDDPDIAAAASHGVTSPATASGTISEL